MRSQPSTLREVLPVVGVVVQVESSTDVIGSCDEVSEDVGRLMVQMKFLHKALTRW